MATSPLQKSPIGLLQAYNLQTLGQAPIGFGDVVVPTTRAEPWYLRDRVGAVTGAGTLAIGQSSAVIASIVPSGESWYVYGAYAFVVPPSADVAFETFVQLRLFIGPANSVTVASAAFLPGINWLSAVTSPRLVNWWAPEPFILRSGDALQCVVETSAAATVAHNAGVIAAVARLSSQSA